MNNRKNHKIEMDEDEFNRTIDLLESAITEVKEIARNLRPLNIEELGLTMVLKMMCSKVAKEAAIKPNVQICEMKSDLDREIEMCIFRVVQEALNNIIRHSKATKFAVDLTRDGGMVNLIISDDGIGFKPKKLMNEKYISEGMGILNMQERVERQNGSFQIDSDFNNGTTIISQFKIDKSFNETKFEDKDSDS